MALTTLTIDELYQEVADLARDQGVADKETWHDLVEEVVEGHADLGELDDEQDTEGMKEVLRNKWEEYKEEAGEESEEGVEDEDEEAESSDGGEDDENEDEEDY